MTDEKIYKIYDEKIWMTKVMQCHTFECIYKIIPS